MITVRGIHRLLIWMLIAAVSLPVVAQQDKDIAFIEADTPLTVEITAGNYVDLVFDAEANQTVTIIARSLETEGILDTVLTVFDGNQVIGENDDHKSGYPDLAPRDSVIDGLTFVRAGEYTIRVNTFSRAAEGVVEVTVVTTSSGAVSTGETTPTQLIISEVLPGAGEYTTTFTGSQGDIVTITVISYSSLDPKVSLVASNGEIVAMNDDHEDNDPLLSSYDSRIRDFALPNDDTYTIRVTGFANSGGAFDLILDVDGETPPVLPQNNDDGDIVVTEYIEEYGSYFHNFQAKAGDVYTITARTLSGSLDPQLYLWNSDERTLSGNRNHGSSNIDLRGTDARIYQFIMPYDDEFTVEVYSYRAAGEFELSIQKIATNAPLGDGENVIVVDAIAPYATYTYTLSAQEGEYITIDVRSLTNMFDPHLTLLNDSGTILIDNDDHNGLVSTLGQLDAQISNFIVPATGDYVIEISGYQDSSGDFALVINTLK